ncbi:uncharacterized protein LOC109823366 [Asparagus officinalis]|uniref:uncharacterized protein LOC109823366 n=1 Tax=Asparagus officinalis TaxID=4686 RepID=UPI00098DF568|nr:uncharacterized protein LOC109823366 [Asparagus officinalis]
MEEELYCAIMDFRGNNHLIPMNIKGTFSNLVAEVQSRIAFFSSPVKLTYEVPYTEELFVRVHDDVDLSTMFDVHLSCKKKIVKMHVDIDRDTLFGLEENTIHIRNPTISLSEQHASSTHNLSNSENALREVERSSIQIPISWYHAIRSVGQEFNDVEHLRQSLGNYSIALGFNFAYLKNEPRRLIVKCKGADCEWMVHCNRRTDCKRFYVKKIGRAHSCLGGGIGEKGHPRASRKWVANIVKSILKEQPTYRAIDLKKKLLREFGVDIPYGRAWCGKELAQQELYGYAKHSYEQFRWYKDKGFVEGCRPILFLDGTHLFDRYKGTLLAATALNGDGGMFPVALCICGTENESNWEWFLECIRDVLYNSDDPYTPNDELVIISDRDKGLQNSVKNCFPCSYHSYCIRHLMANYKNNLSKKRLPAPLRDDCVQIMKRAAYAYTMHAYHNEYNELQNKSSIAFIEMLNMSPQNWANCYFPGKRYGWLTSNLAESFNAWIKEARFLPIAQLVDHIRVKMMKMSYDRREESNKWATPLVPSVEEHLVLINEGARCLHVNPSTSILYEVYDSPSVRVNLEYCTCTCRQWQVLGLPCKHAAAVIRHKDQLLYPYISDYFSMEVYRKCHSFPIYPIPDDEKPIITDENMEIRPPLTSIRRGRPKTKRIPSGLNPSRMLKCSRFNVIVISGWYTLLKTFDVILSSICITVDDWCYTFS